MGRLLDTLFRVDHYETELDQARVRAIYNILLLALILFTIYTVGQSLWDDVLRGTIQTFSIPAFYIVVLVTVLLLRFGKVSSAEFGMPLMLLVALIPPALNGGLKDTGDITLLVLFMTMFTLFKRERGLVFSLAITIILLVIGLARRETLPDLPANFTPEQNVTDFFLVTLELLGISGVMAMFLRFLQLNRAEGEASIQGKRAAMAQITTKITQQISHQLSLQETMDNAVELISANFADIYHAQVFLLNETGTQAELLASTGEVGKLLKQRRHNLKVGGRSVIGQVTGEQGVVVAYAGVPDSIHRYNDLLPNTAVEAAFPLQVGTQLIGALDLQSRNPKAFSADDLPAFQGLADHLAIAIDNARLFDEAEETIRQNQYLIEQSRSNTEEVLRLNRQLTRQIWADHLRGKTQDMALDINFQENTREQGGVWTHTLREAVQSNHTIQQRQDGQRIVAVPVRVRGEVIGAMEFELDETGNLTPEDI
ncbi:MAG: GAF domain-containing protein, partial [Anaerolineae bacterium]|nr:GAF domain-containing protein [Anaerolineae bacterium]